MTTLIDRSEAQGADDAPTGVIAPVGAPPRPRRLRTFTFDDWASLGGAALASLALVTVLYEHVLDLSGTVGYLVCWFVLFQALYGALVAVTNPRPLVVDRLIATTVWAAAGLVVFALLTTVFSTFHSGWAAVMHLNFFTHDAGGVSPTAPLNQGGVLHALLGTLIQVGIALLISLPLGVATAVYMSEIGGRWARPVRTMVEAMTALPEILAGLFIYVTLVLYAGMGKTGFAVAVAISVTMIPIIARSSEVALRVVPAGLREAGAALGAPRWKTTLRVILPTAKAGLATAAILGVARGIGETAIPLLCSGASNFVNLDPFHNEMNSLPLYIFTSIKTGEPLMRTRGYGAAILLLVLVLVFFSTARLLSRSRNKGQR